MHSVCSLSFETQSVPVTQNIDQCHVPGPVLACTDSPSSSEAVCQLLSSSCMQTPAAQFSRTCQKGGRSICIHRLHTPIMTFEIYMLCCIGWPSAVVARVAHLGC